MAACENKIFKDIYSNCEHPIVSGIEQTVYLFNRADITIGFGTGVSGNGEKNEIVSLTLKSGKKGYVAKGLKKNLTCGFERQQSDTAPDYWSNSITLLGYEFDKDAMRNMDELGDIVAIIDRKGPKDVDGSFLMLGATNGLYVSADTWGANDNGGARQITMSSLDEAGEPYSAFVVTLSGQTPAITTYEGVQTYLESLLEEPEAGDGEGA